MFKKLLTNLPYNPSLIGQVSFYAKRLHGEEQIRRLGFVFVVLAFLVQMFAFISRPEPTLAESDNDILRGGFSTRAEAASKCRSNTQDFATILSYYGVNCDQVASARTETIRSNAADYDSLGRNQQGPTIYRPVTGRTNPTDEYAVQIPGLRTLWMRNLRAWDSYAYSDYKVLKITKSDGRVIMILFDCGNIVTVGKYPPPPPPTPCPYNPALRQSDPACQPPKCPQNPNIPASDSRCVACPYNPQILRSDKRCQQCPYPGLGGIGKDDPLCKEPCPYNPTIRKEDSACKPCEASETDQDATACLILTKKARNNTQDIENADGTVASAGDSITYTLSVKNDGKAKIEDYLIEENVSDILDYAEIIDLNGAKLEGTLVSWPATNLSAGETVRKRLVVKIKNPIPRTPISASDPGRFDLVMNNVYGNQVTIKLPADIVKTTEVVTQTLPNTGPGETMAAVVGFTIFVGYFFARTRLFAKEMDIVRTDYATSGGY